MYVGTEPPTLVAKGYVLYSTANQLVHGKALPPCCYKVSVQEAIKPAAILPNQGKKIVTVEDVLHGFVAWPKNLISFDTPEEVIFILLHLFFCSLRTSLLCSLYK